MDLSCETNIPTMEGFTFQDTIPFTLAMRNNCVMGSPTSLKSSVPALLCRSDIIMRIVTIDLESLNTMWIIESQVAGMSVVTVIDNRVRVVIRPV